jgi:hypothetical protein
MSWKLRWTIFARSLTRAASPSFALPMPRPVTPRPRLPSRETCLPPAAPTTEVHRRAGRRAPPPPRPWTSAPPTARSTRKRTIAVGRASIRRVGTTGGRVLGLGHAPGRRMIATTGNGILPPEGGRPTPCRTGAGTRTARTTTTAIIRIITRTRTVTIAEGRDHARTTGTTGRNIRRVGLRV